MGHDKDHGGEHVDGTDDIQDATDSVKGLATSTQITKLDGIDTNAVDAAGAVTAMGAKADGNPLHHDRPIQATEAVVGLAEIATQAETNTGTDDTKMVTPNKLANYSGLDPTKERRYFISQRVRVGTGGSAASEGQIQDAPVILFNATQDQEAFIANHIRPAVDLSSVNPKIECHFIAAATAAGVGTETARFQLEIRYRADGEGLDGAYDETLTIDIDLPTGVAFVHFHQDFTLDRTKMAVRDCMTIRIVRLGTHGNDDYDDSVGFAQAELVYQGTGGV